MYAIIDCNNFYASCERLFKPSLRGKPVVVLSNNDGCIIARSNEAKALGIPMGAPYFQSKKLMEDNGVAVFSSNYTLYADISNRVHSVIRDFMPQTENYSIDEAFADMAGIPNPQEVALQLRQRIYDWVGIPVSIGVAPTKTLAKVANRIAKKQPQYGGVYVINTEAKREQALKGTNINDVWGVGRQITKSLNSAGIFNGWELAQSDTTWIRQKYSVVMQRTVQELKGESCIALEAVAPVKKGITCSRSFGIKLTEIEPILEAVSSYAERAGVKMREQGLYAQVINVMLRNSPFGREPFYGKSVCFALPIATDDTAILIKYAKEGIRHLYKPGLRFMKCGIDLLELIPSTSHQLDLLEKPTHNYDREKREALMAALDGINNKMGSKTITFASSGIEQGWSMNRRLNSPHYTTQWKDLPVAKAGLFG